MAIDHLLGTEREDENGLADPAMFAISASLCVVAAVLVFGWLVPRSLRAGEARAAVVGLACSVGSIVPGVAVMFVGVPLVVAGGGIALGVESRNGPRRIVALAAVVIGSLYITAIAVAYVVAAVT
jgi:hypothetical protein